MLRKITAAPAAHTYHQPAFNQAPAGASNAIPGASTTRAPANPGETDLHRLKSLLLERIGELAQHLYPRGRRIGPHWCIGDATGAPGASFKIRLTGEKAGLHGDFATGEKHSASPLDLWKTARGVDFATAVREASAWLGLEPRPQPIRRTRPAPRASETVRKIHLPAMNAGTPADWEELARLRGLDPAACQVASAAGWLRFGTWRHERAWFIVDTEGRNGQARRLDGHPWADGRKAWTFQGARASWPIGLKEAEHYPAVLFVEGGPDLLAALHFLHAQRDWVSWCPLAMLGAKMPIPEEALDRLRGRRARIYVHADAEGLAAARRWTAQLLGRGFQVDCFGFDGLRRADGAPVKDLNDAALLAPEQASELEGLLP